MQIRSDVEAAATRIAGRVRHTPLEPSPSLSAESGARVHLKLENLQRTGSFKLRGATNKLLCMSEPERRQGVIAASTGNHGAAVACAGRDLGVPVVVFAPEHAARGKLAAMRSMGAEVRLVGDDCLVAELAARAFAEETGRCYISPYNDPEVVAGQGTLAIELLEDLPDMQALVLST
jgi:threonine dehydratase